MTSNVAQSQPLIEVRNVSLAYRLAHNRPGSLKEFSIRLAKRQVHYERLLALDEVTFSVARGEVFAVVGSNGAGKSTLLKVLARVLPPGGGRVIVRGTVAPMIELGAGFNHELTARENILIYGSILGRPAGLMRERVPEILAWAELSSYADVPLRSFSSGMLARLGFAVATDVDPDVLIVDEVLSVGDLAFQRRSEDRIGAMVERGTGVVVVSHNLSTVEKLATRAMWLDGGRVREMGAVTEVVNSYRSAS